MAYVYKITCRVTNQYYYGYRCYNETLKKEPREDLWRYYFTSSKDIKNLIKEHGKDSFETLILAVGNKEDCFWWEQELIKAAQNDPFLLNRYYRNKDQGMRAFTGNSSPYKGKKRGPASDTHKAKMREINGKKMTTEMRQRISNTLKSKGKRSPEVINKIKETLKKRYQEKGGWGNNLK